MSLRTNPVEGLSALERSEMKYVPHVRKCDDASANFARIRTTKPKSLDAVKEAIPQNSNAHAQQNVVSITDGSGLSRGGNGKAQGPDNKEHNEQYFKNHPQP